jgi:hypothetical protein
MSHWIFVKQSGVSATGGTITESGGYRYHTFTADGTFEVASGGEVEALIVAGGGSGARHDTNTGIPSGGGAGGVIVKSYTVYTIGGVDTDGSPLSVSSGSYTVTVGNGGAARSTQVAGENGANSSVVGAGVSLTAIGGGQGNHSGAVTGGSGGGRSSVFGGGGAAGTAGQGFASTKRNPPGGAGATSTNPVNGDGGSGIEVWGTTYAGGGGGYPGGLGGSGGGGAASASAGTAATSGTANTGGGGGGGYQANSGAGGSGIVIIRYAI